MVIYREHVLRPGHLDGDEPGQDNVMRLGHRDGDEPGRVMTGAP